MRRVSKKYAQSASSSSSYTQSASHPVDTLAICYFSMDSRCLDGAHTPLIHCEQSVRTDNPVTSERQILCIRTRYETLYITLRLSHLPCRFVVVDGAAAPWNKGFITRRVSCFSGLLHLRVYSFRITRECSAQLYIYTLNALSSAQWASDTHRTRKQSINGSRALPLGAPLAAASRHLTHLWHVVLAAPAMRV